MVEEIKDSQIFKMAVYEMLHVRFPWRCDIGALSCNNGIVQHCYVSLATKQ
jgi:hypothetical protein